jgi:hypothetical protein
VLLAFLLLRFSVFVCLCPCIWCFLVCVPLDPLTARSRERRGLSRAEAAPHPAPSWVLWPWRRRRHACSLLFARPKLESEGRGATTARGSCSAATAQLTLTNLKKKRGGGRCRVKVLALFISNPTLVRHRTLLTKSKFSKLAA